MKVIVFIAILGLSLAGFRPDTKKVGPWISQHRQAIEVSGNSNSNSEELFNFLGSIESGIATAAADVQGTAETAAADAQGTAETAAADIQGTINNVASVAQGTAGVVTQNLPGFINASEGAIGYAAQHFNTTQALQDVGEGVTLAGTALQTTEGILKIVNAGMAIAGDAFVSVQGLIQTASDDIQGTVNTASGDIQGTVDTASTVVQGAVQNVEGAVGAGSNALGGAIQSINEPEVIQAANDAATAIGTGLDLANSALKIVNEGLSIAGDFTI